jgi:hypothetical protein
MNVNDLPPIMGTILIVAGLALVGVSTGPVPRGVKRPLGRARTFTDCHRESSSASKRSPRWDAAFPSRLIFSGHPDPVALTAWRNDSGAESTVRSSQSSE